MDSYAKQFINFIVCWVLPSVVLIACSVTLGVHFSPPFKINDKDKPDDEKTKDTFKVVFAVIFLILSLSLMFYQSIPIFNTIVDRLRN